ncbi:MAG: TIGR04211 family SH3 domain-containing protein [Magnetococcales bacterium]|nr:TIGR04211 family SH3 domain-containing protein [Magnetococcales bacterium]
MRKFRFTCLISLGLMGIWPGSTPSAWGEILYVTDQFTITLRKGKDINQPEIRSLPTGTRVELLEQGEKGWGRVRTESGQEGWVLKRYLIPEKPARMRLEEVLEAQRRVEAERDALGKQVAILQNGLQAQGQLKEELERIKRISSSALAMEKEIQSLREHNREVNGRLAALQEEKETLEAQSSTTFFLAGAGVLILGFVAGGFLSRRRQRGTYNSLM